MKLNESYLRSKVGEDTVLVPTGAYAERFRGIVRLNETALAIIDLLAENLNENQIVDSIMNEYDAERSVVEKHVNQTIEKLKSVGVILD